MVGLKSQWERKSHDIVTIIIPYDAFTTRGARVSLGGSVKVGFMPAFRGEKPLGFLSFPHSVFHLLLFPATHLKFSPLPHRIVFLDVTIYLPPYYYSRLVSISEDLVVSLIPYAPAKMRQDPGTYFLQDKPIEKAIPLIEKSLAG